MTTDKTPTKSAGARRKSTKRIYREALPSNVKWMIALPVLFFIAYLLFGLIFIPRLKFDTKQKMFSSQNQTK